MPINEQIKEMHRDLEHLRSVKDNFGIAKELQKKDYRKLERGE